MVVLPVEGFVNGISFQTVVFSWENLCLHTLVSRGQFLTRIVPSSFGSMCLPPLYSDLFSFFSVFSLSLEIVSLLIPGLYLDSCVK